MYNEEQISRILLIVSTKGLFITSNSLVVIQTLISRKYPTCIHYIAARDIRANEEITADYWRPNDA